jgi:uncharacterized protein (UPF0332 family)
VSKELILYRREKARETIEDARLLLDADRLFSALNRIYYALFYEVVALLLTRGLSSVKHSGVRALLNENFVKTGKVSVEIGRFFSRMYDFRQKSDYGDFVKFEKDKVKDWLEQASSYIKEIDRIIEEYLSQ